MKKLLLPLLFLVAFQISAQGKLQPPCPEISDYSLSQFLTKLTLAVGKKDKKFILDHMSPHILNSFGGDGGIEEFKAYWDFDSADSKFWEVTEQVLLIGGPKHKKDAEDYIIPFTFSDWPEDYDAFEHFLVLGTNVNVRDKPNTQDSQILGQFSYQIVKWNRTENDNSNTEPQWYNVSSVDGKLTGYVFGNYLVSPIGYRMGLTKTEKGWVISLLVAGD
ncbi:SH3 domain-containing protein [Flagellimonas beolgyonensis]|uniref:SH3 domain-containing protein n=1 Tax=Flagellimonas beolgyonensis TaxID=864064 RepID=UPI000F8EB2CE|nr:SH3 domain-containing protein [Allomuricauda beolgyonensis]